MSSAGVLVLSPVREESLSILPPSPMNSEECIWIYLSMPGSMIPMRVLESDSIESVKLRIQSYKGFVVKNQKLVSGGRELARSNSLIRDYGVTDGNVLHLVLRLSELQVIYVRTSCGKEFTFHVERSRDVGYVKRQISKKKKNLEDIEDQEVLCNGKPVEDQRRIRDVCRNNNDAVIHLFVRKSSKIRARPVEKNFELSIDAPQLTDVRGNDSMHKESEYGSELKSGNNLRIPRKPLDGEILLEPVILNPKIQLPPEIRDLISSTLDGLDRGSYPVRSSEGTGGAYFMLDAVKNKYLSVFKPIDEEPMAVNNPRGLPLSEDGEGLKKGTRVGEGAFRECAAYLLDHPKCGRRSFSGEVWGFSRVPPTVLVRCLHRGFNHPEGVNVKIGSLQMFVENNGSCEDMGPTAFPAEEVHKIAVLDMRMANADRHAGNILVSKGEDGQTMLIPIDHGYCLPESFEDCTFDWLYWPQARLPFNDDTANYIKSLDAEEDIALLKFYGWDLPLECARVLRISTMLLKKGAERKLPPFAIGKIMCRATLNKESVIEEIVKEALDSVLPGSSESALLESVSCIMDRHLEDIA
ncbi:phosphatidylinositol 4-kinase gamma 4-like [Olea europaea subsp. europaea]|uniref:1-phosphatidylinositol 4-kinase n=1 Tax=Olea europaea subsp. europaea TaxID=158383 RepID=A0A385A1L1_OLEEU|nr:phosphatidylinositol 4-kinase gamma 4 [Olea europaea subsp. europaea]CAA2982462.1 phosphatidylinositol 4-kinase gamma 4-like [Olea europaea subsp. europaea]